MRVERDGIALNAHVSGDGPPVLFLHALGLDHTIWADVMGQMPNHRLIAMDLRGHGASDAPPPAYAMGALIADAEAVLEAAEARDAVVIGISLGGMIAQGLAVKRLDLVRALVLSNTAARFGQPGPWQDRAALVQAQGMAAIEETTLTRWFGRGASGPAVDAARALLRDCDPQGYAGGCTAIAGTDFYTPTSGLRLPTLGIAGDRDGSTPPDLVRETLELIPGSDVRLMRRSGHLPCLDAPEAMAALIRDFLARIGHS
ncbi:MAG: 3-oxoadipate enol-lactonase [Rhodobacteraceae bacterium HLUCCA08]|nr:MAG: 3-oxoadipate enol-lactonase [Rhodobacteraceae bacterium HLUCCA08]